MDRENSLFWKLYEPLLRISCPHCPPPLVARLVTLMQIDSVSNVCNFCTIVKIVLAFHATQFLCSLPVLPATLILLSLVYLQPYPPLLGLSATLFFSLGSVCNHNLSLVSLQQIHLFGLSATIFLSGCTPSGLPLVSPQRGSLDDKKGKFWSRPHSREHHLTLTTTKHLS